MTEPYAAPTPTPRSEHTQRAAVPLAEFIPPAGLANPHLQTVMSSVARKMLLPRREAAFLEAAEEHIVEVDGVRLMVHANLHEHQPLIMMIPGWLGNSRSSYVLSCAKALYEAGYSVARINLRDHGDTAHLNQGLFNSALIDEVVTLSQQLPEQFNSRGAGLIGYSLGGNFALRVARAIPNLPVLAICPAIAPANTMTTIDRNVVYQRYFVQKWRASWTAKQNAFPEIYNVSDAFKLTTVASLTDYFITYHSGFPTASEYFAAYDLSGSALEGVSAQILAARGDPIIPYQQYQNLPGSINIELTDKGGHGAYLESWNLASWADRYAVEHFAQFFS
ncbi:MAG: alpha/beta fold hydrolase [Pseudomonadota bacterium]